MAHMSTNNRTLLATMTLAATVCICSVASSQIPPMEVAIVNAGKTGLAPGRYRLELGPGNAAKGQSHHLTLMPISGPARRHRYDARSTGCGNAAVETLAWTPKVAPRPDGSLQIQLTSRSVRGCRIVASIPAGAVPGIEGSPIGTAGAPSQKAPGIEGSPIGTAGAPGNPGVTGRTGSADREIAPLIQKARQALPAFECDPFKAQAGTSDAQEAELRSSLDAVARASSPASAIPHLRRFDAAREALYRKLASDRTSSAGARRCEEAERRCAASGSVSRGCGIDGAVCLARLVCGNGK